MDKYTITFSKEYGGRYYQSVVEAIDETDAFLKAIAEAESKGIKLPDEVWIHTKKHKK